MKDISNRCKTWFTVTGMVYNNNVVPFWIFHSLNSAYGNFIHSMLHCWELPYPTNVQTCQHVVSESTLSFGHNAQKHKDDADLVKFCTMKDEIRTKQQNWTMNQNNHSRKVMGWLANSSSCEKHVLRNVLDNIKDICHVNILFWHSSRRPSLPCINWEKLPD